ncbi:MAG: apolipoprotein N-acyltransferase [Pseudomonadota bacterium]
MKRTRALKNLLYAILSGLLLTASFPPGKFEWVAWFALVPLLKSLEDVTPFRAFKLGLLAGFAHYITLIYWIIVVLGHYGGLDIFTSMAVLILFCLYLSLYPALFSLLAGLLNGKRSSLFITASLWVSLEYLRAHFLTGFPWCLIGHTQYRTLGLIQIADLAGVYGISFLLVLSNCLIAVLLFSRHPLRRPCFKLDVSLFVILLALTLLYGHQRSSGNETVPEVGQRVRVAVIQGNIDQSVKWEPAYQERTIEKYRQLSLSSGPYKPHLIVWPETSVPFFFQEKTDLSKEVSLLPGQLKAYLLFGSPAYGMKDGRNRYFNRVFVLSPAGEVAGQYDKTHLVPFGEYVPLKRFLPFVRRIVTAVGDFAPGTKIEPLKVPGFPPGILICFEVIFPELARTHVRKGAAILVNLTNDAWFGKTSAPYQHLSMAVFRAVENRRPLIRAANTGISAFISKEGKMISRGEIFQEQVLREEIVTSVPPPGFYTKYGDIFAALLTIICLIKIFFLLCYNHRIGRTKRSGLKQ